MNNKEFQEMLKVFNRLVELIEKFQSEMTEEDEITLLETPLMIPPDLYDEICEMIKEKEILLFGIS
tara:strand:- start:148 stop:345 length:198 start_codon:yes stop_codon:yes gene_type:complete